LTPGPHPAAAQRASRPTARRAAPTGEPPLLSSLFSPASRASQSGDRRLTTAGQGPARQLPPPLPHATGRQGSHPCTPPRPACPAPAGHRPVARTP
jgi:hypothetical protein